MPTGYSWSRIGERKIVPYEAPEGRRVNVVGAISPFDPQGPHLVFESRRKDQGKYDAEAHLRFVYKVAGLPQVLPDSYRRERPCVIVLDNYSVHHSQSVQDRVPELETVGVRFFFLPPYSSELNLIEPVWRQIKYQELPERSHKTANSLQAAVDAALTKYAKQLLVSCSCSKTNGDLCQAA